MTETATIAMTTRTMIRTWLREGQAVGATHMLVFWDTFDGPDGNYPVYVLPGDDPRVIREITCRGGGIKFVECYSYGLSLDIQVAQERAQNLDLYPPYNGPTPKVRLGTYRKGLGPELGIDYNALAVGRLDGCGWEIERYFTVADFPVGTPEIVALVKMRALAGQLVGELNRVLHVEVYFAISAYVTAGGTTRLYFEDTHECGDCTDEVDTVDYGYCPECTRKQNEAGTRCVRCDSYPIDEAHACEENDDDGND